MFAIRTPFYLLLLALPRPSPRSTTRGANGATGKPRPTADVLAFLDSLRAADSDTEELALAGARKAAGPGGARGRPMVRRAGCGASSGKAIVYLQANIHAGEVEGKRGGADAGARPDHGPLRPLLDSVILLVVPIYNADGNEPSLPAGRTGRARTGRPGRANGRMAGPRLESGLRQAGGAGDPSRRSR